MHIMCDVNMPLNDPSPRWCLSFLVRSLWNSTHDLWFIVCNSGTTIKAMLTFLRFSISENINESHVYLPKNNTNQPDFLLKKKFVDMQNWDFEDILLIEARPSTQKYFRLRGSTVLDPGCWKGEDTHMEALEQYLVTHPNG